MLAVIILCTTHTQPVHVLQMWQTTLRAQHEHNVVSRPYMCLPQQWVNSSRSTPLGLTPSIFYKYYKSLSYIFSFLFYFLLLPLFVPTDRGFADVVALLLLLSSSSTILMCISSSTLFGDWICGSSPFWSDTPVKIPC